MDSLVIAIDDPRRDDVRALLVRHLQFAADTTPPDDIHALDLDGLLDPAITFCSGRSGGQLMAIGALKRLDDTHGELKSMHTAEAARGLGIGRAMVDHLLDLARHRGYQRVSLETGVMDAFLPARSLYERAGFVRCRPFADYPDSADSAYMTITLT